MPKSYSLLRKEIPAFYPPARSQGQRTEALREGSQPVQVGPDTAKVLIDKADIARFVQYGHDLKDIPSNEETLSLVGQINPTRNNPSQTPGQLSGEFDSHFGDIFLRSREFVRLAGYTRCKCFGSESIESF